VTDVYLITDNGYHNVSTMVAPLTLTFRIHTAEVFRSGWLESVRKDVECTFGILKKRFKIQRNHRKWNMFSVSISNNNHIILGQMMGVIYLTLIVRMM
jgi:hypothetical protein